MTASGIEGTYAPLEEPLPPIYTDPSVPGTIGWATAQRGLTPCPGCGLPKEEGLHGPHCNEAGELDESLDSVFRSR